jgi:hypothetical protein
MYSCILLLLRLFAAITGRSNDMLGLWAASFECPVLHFDASTIDCHHSWRHTRSDWVILLPWSLHNFIPLYIVTSVHSTATVGSFHGRHHGKVGVIIVQVLEGKIGGQWS